MNCTFCGGIVKNDTTEYIEKQGNYIVVIKNVPCEKCEQCGEVYFSNEVALMLEKYFKRNHRYRNRL